jgi:DNA-binding transcriptional MerR regulator
MITEPKPAHDDAPIYNIKAVARLVNLLPVTLRAWERRYGLPSPKRGDQGYRLYSEHDVRTLRWLKAQVDAGMSIGRASDLLQELCSNHQDPAFLSGPAVEQPTSLTSIHKELYHALTQYNLSGATLSLQRAFAIYSLDQVLLNVVQPTLVEMGDAWHRGELPIAVEHFATQFCLQHLMSMLNSSAPPYQPGTILAACAPGEMHQIGLLMLVVMLRWRGWDVKYFGQDLKLDHFEDTIQRLNPRLILFTATRKETAAALQELPELFRKLPEPHPILVVGGQGFRQAKEKQEIPGIFIDSSPTDTVKLIESMLTHSSAAPLAEITSQVGTIHYAQV